MNQSATPAGGSSGRHNTMMRSEVTALSGNNKISIDSERKHEKSTSHNGTTAMSKEAPPPPSLPPTHVSNSKSQQVFASSSQVSASKSQKPLPESRKPYVAAVSGREQQRTSYSTAQTRKWSTETVERKPSANTKQGEGGRDSQRGSQSLVTSKIAAAFNYMIPPSSAIASKQNKEIQTLNDQLALLNKTIAEKEASMRQLGRDIESLNRKLQEKDDTIKRFTEEKVSIAVELERVKESLANLQKSTREDNEKYENEIKTLQTTIMHRKKDLVYTTDDPTIRSKYQNICRKINTFLRGLIRYDPNSTAHFESTELLDHPPFFEYLSKMLPNSRVAILLCHLLHFRSNGNSQPALLNDVITGIAMNIIAEEVFDQELKILSDDFKLWFSKLFTIVKDFNGADPGRLSAVMSWRSDLFRMLIRESRSQTGEQEFPVECRPEQLIENVCKRIEDVLGPVFRNYKTSNTSEDDFKRKTTEGLHGVVNMALDLALVLARQRADYRLTVKAQSRIISSTDPNIQLQEPGFVIYPGLVKWGNEDAKNFDEPFVICPPKAYYLTREDVAELTHYFKLEISLEMAIIKTCFNPRKTAIPNADVIVELLNLFPGESSASLPPSNGIRTLDSE